MIELTKRQEMILGLIVREYVNTPTPVSSKLLVEHYDLDVSSATVRNDMAVLEELGMLYAPHTSAGRVPTEEGYRYFVQRLIGDPELTAAEQRMIRHQFHQNALELEQWFRLAASVLAHTVRSASVVTSPVPYQARFKHVELISTHGRLVLMVLVLENGDVRQQMLTLAEPVSQEMLSSAAARINGQCQGLGGTEVRARATRQGPLDQDLMMLVADLLEGSGAPNWVIYTDGLTNILDPTPLLGAVEPVDAQSREEISRALLEVDSQGARQTLRLLEEKSLLGEILAETMTPGVQGVHVMIAGDGRWEELSHTSAVLSHYGIDGFAIGALGILGPTRLHYGRAISAVRYVAGMMNDMLLDIYGEGEQAN